MKTYLVEPTGTAEAEAERSYLRYGRTSLEVADRWQTSLVKAMVSLSSMPNRCPVAPESRLYPGTVIRHLVFGKHRLLFHVVEPAEDEAQGVVRVLHVLHGAQVLRHEQEQDDDGP